MESDGNLRNAGRKARYLNGRRVVRLGTVTELSILVPTPAFRRAGNHRAGVVYARRYLRYSRNESGYLYRRSAARDTSVSEASVSVVSPAFRRAGNHRAGHILSCRNLRYPRGESRSRYGNETARYASVAEFAVRIVSPAFRRAGNHRAGVLGAGFHFRNPRSEPDDLRRGRTVRRRRPDTELAVRVVSPAFRRAGNHRAGEVRSTGDLRYARSESGYGRRNRFGVFLGAVSDFSEYVLSAAGDSSGSERASKRIARSDVRDSSGSSPCGRGRVSDERLLDSQVSVHVSSRAFDSA